MFDWVLDAVMAALEVSSITEQSIAQSEQIKLFVRYGSIYFK